MLPASPSESPSQSLPGQFEAVETRTIEIVQPRNALSHGDHLQLKDLVQEFATVVQGSTRDSLLSVGRRLPSEPCADNRAHTSTHNLPYLSIFIFISGNLALFKNPIKREGTMKLFRLDRGLNGLSTLLLVLLSTGAAYGDSIFVTSLGTGTIGEYTTSGAVVNASLVGGVGNHYGLAVSGSDLFLTNFFSGTINEYATSGAMVNAALVMGLSGPYDIAVSGSDLFVTNIFSGTIGEYTTSGAVVNAALVTGLNNPTGIAVSGSDLFVTSLSGTIGEDTTSCGGVNAW